MERVIYLERIPAAPLSQSVRMLWYTRAPHVAHQRERVLPNGCVQIVINLARDFLLDCVEDSPQVHRMAPALIVGARSIYETVDCSDMADLAGVVFHPGGFACFASDPVDRFSNRSISLFDVWGQKARSLRDRLRDAPTAQDKLCLLEKLLLENLALNSGRDRVVRFALARFAQNPGMYTVRDIAAETGWSMRHFSQIFREQVGLTPKIWCRLQRFQQAVKQLHAGTEVRWSELALDCGYYDQAHFANEFRAFSGIDATSYSAGRTRWANHVPVAEAAASDFSKT